MEKNSRLTKRKLSVYMVLGDEERTAKSQNRRKRVQLQISKKISKCVKMNDKCDEKIEAKEQITRATKRTSKPIK